MTSFTETLKQVPVELTLVFKVYVPEEVMFAHHPISAEETKFRLTNKKKIPKNTIINNLFSLDNITTKKVVLALKRLSRTQKLSKHIL